MSELMQLHRQWANRPAEEVFLSLPDMLAAMNASKQNSQSKVLKLKDLTAKPFGEDVSGLQIIGPSGNPATISNWAFNQLCMKAEIPAGYIASLPGNLASENVNYALSHVSNQDIGVLITKYPELENALQIRAVTGDGYTRIFNSDVVQELMKYVGNGVNDTNWRHARVFGKEVPLTKETATMFGNDKNIFICLTDEENRVEIPNRRDGKPGTLARGFMVWNSEVGDQTFGIRTFLFDYICANRIVWGAQNVVTFKRRHTKNVLDVWQDGYKQIEAYKNAKASDDQKQLLQAISYRVVDLGKTVTNESEQDAAKRRSEEATKFLKTKLALPVVPNKLVDNIKAAFIKAENRPIETLWDCVTGVTEYAKVIPYQEERVKLETAGGKLLDLVAN